MFEPLVAFEIFQNNLRPPINTKEDCKMYTETKWSNIDNVEPVPIIFFFYGCTALVGLGRFSSSLIYTQSVGLLGRLISPSQGCYLEIGQHKHRINAHRHSYLERDSNQRSQRPSERGQVMP
jgi:hypothetical protein